LTIIQKQVDPNTAQSFAEKELQDDRVIQALGITIAAINTTKDLVPINLAKGILGTIGSILGIVQVRWCKPLIVWNVSLGIYSR
jgi:hypothetical protein